MENQTFDVDGERVRDLRERKLWTKTELCRRSGVGFKTLERIEAGECQPRRITALKLAAALGVDVKEFAAAIEPETTETTVSR